MISAEAGEQAYRNLKELQVGKYRVTMRPHSSELALFAPGIKANITEEMIVRSFGRFGKISACSLSKKRESFMQNATINFSSE